MKNNTHLHFIVYAYEKQDEKGTYINNTILDLLASSVEQALAKSAKILPLRANYTIVQIIEHFEGACK